MSILNYLLAFENFPFIFSLLFAIIFALGSAFGLGHSDGDAHAEADADGDVHHDMEASGGHAHGHGHGQDHKDGHPLETTPDHHRKSVVMRVLSTIGVGKVPITIVLTTWCFLFGITGMVTNQFLAPIFKIGVIYGSVSMAIATLVALAFTGRFARLLNWIMPTSESYATDHTNLIGCNGVLELTTTTSFGRASVRGRNGDMHTIRCKVTEGELATGSKIHVVDFDDETETYIVVKGRDAESLLSQV